MLHLAQCGAGTKKVQPLDMVFCCIDVLQLATSCHPSSRTIFDLPVHTISNTLLARNGSSSSIFFFADVSIMVACRSEKVTNHDSCITKGSV